MKTIQHSEGLKGRVGSDGGVRSAGTGKETITQDCFSTLSADGTINTPGQTELSKQNSSHTCAHTHSYTGLVVLLYNQHTHTQAELSM